MTEYATAAVLLAGYILGVASGAGFGYRTGRRHGHDAGRAEGRTTARSEYLAQVHGYEEVVRELQRRLVEGRR